MFLIKQAPRLPSPIHRCKKTLRRKINFLNKINLICPVQSPSKKYFCFSELQITLYSSHPVPPKGAYHDRRETRGGVRWTRAGLARKADGRAGFPVSDRRARGRRARSRTVKSCGPGASTPVSSLRGGMKTQPGGRATFRGGDGDKQARSPGRARSKPLKPLRGECRVIPV